MNSFKRKKFYKIGLLVFILILSFSFSILLYNVFENILFEKLSIVMGVVSEESKNLEIKSMKHLKSNHSSYKSIGKKVLKDYGYSRDSFIFLKDKNKVIHISSYFSFIITFILYIYIKISNENKKRNIETLKGYLESINKGDHSLYLDIDEDYEILSDELYKTVVKLKEMEEKSVQDKVNLKENIADISHQLKTPITSINIMCELIEGSDSKKDNREYINRLNRQIRRLEELTSSLLTMSKLDSDTIEFKKERVDIKEIIELAIEPIMFLIDRKNIKINITGEETTVEGDINWISEGFLNIIKNCVEHLGNNGVIDILFQSNPIFTEVCIEDNGNGFLKEDMPYIFKRFYKGRTSNNHSAGIGLSMAKTIIEKHNGEISVENKEEGGARFRIKFY